MNLSKIKNKTIISMKRPPNQRVLNPEIAQFARQTTVRGYYKPSGSHKKSLIKDICEEMLINGNIDSYVNFFYLTHSTENQNESINNVINSNKNKENEDYEKEERKYFEIKTYNEDNYNEDNINKGKSISVDNLYNFNSLFVGIEECERLDDPLEEYKAKKKLAEYFGRLNNWNEAIKYYQNAYESISLLKNKTELLLESIYNIGRAYEKNNQIVKALAHYTKCRDDSIKNEDRNYELISSKKIVKLRLIIANKLDKKKKYEKEIEHYKKCINIIKNSYNDNDEINAITFRLGTAYYNNNDLDKAITLFNEFIDNFDDDSSKNEENRRLAHASIADCYVRKNNLEEAIVHLEKFISYDTKNDKQKQAQIEALNKLGMIYNKRGEYKKAVVCFDKHFQLLNTVKDEKDQNVNDPKKFGILDSKNGSYMGISQERIMNEKTEEENHLRFQMKFNESMDPLFASESQTSIAGEKGDTAFDRVIRNSKKLNEALIQMGVAKADTELERFFTWVQKSDNFSLKSLLQWKANRNIVDYEEDSDNILINSERDKNNNENSTENPSNTTTKENVNENDNINENNNEELSNKNENSNNDKNENNDIKEMEIDES
ncbi:TPR-like protein [Neocallimastix lanati (nom. inval.)]|uniref:Tetratricopeptide repeat protein 29 n=1 Tax=Neocallimastix californiae TaxID=1754190 RepID=A0A1Y2EGY0_9FUNG|nr:TPR-like protein [Neocallimastix sp. JGI-2020a]ORY70677.1 TPR-like protein [Neocallimastix californiae]|eukprot:ORY70677.1 TPR-like protein [Neocallimastix californiae]